MKKLILILLLFVGLNAQVYDLLGTAQRIKDLDVHPSWVSFDGVDDYYSVADNDNLNFGTGDFSLEFYGSITGSDGRIFLKHSGTTGYILDIPSATSIRILMGDGTANVQKTFAVTYTDKDHFIATFDRDGVASLYKNGSLVGTLDISSNTGSVSNSDQLILFGNPYMEGKGYGARVYNRALSASEVTSLYNYGHPELYQLPYADRGASNTDLLSGWDFTSGWSTSGSTTIDSSTGFTVTGGSGIYKPNYIFTTSTIGKKFRIRIAGNTTSTQLALGHSNGSGSEIINKTLSGTFDTTVSYTHAAANGLFLRDYDANSTTTITTFEITRIGAVAEFYPENATSYSWIDASGNNLHAQGNNSPTAVRNPLEDGTIKQFKGSIAANTNTTLTGIVPKGYRIRAIRAVGSDSLTAVKIGTSSGGEEIVASTTTTGTTPKLLTLASTSNNAYSETADVTLYARHDTGASGKTMNLIFILEKVNK